ncbi:hypothetical protein [Actinoplanes sp. DH11]|uniref:hypothetical protein n=1 Tax=Actinoplanes sp. DH11 TaxID=2857011 RepID=UPI001E4A20BA|nr:hypothetical protein [Actinoplanes sp. DH11]
MGSAAIAFGVLVGAVVVPAGSASAATGQTCANSTLSDGSVVARACINWENPSTVGSGPGRWDAGEPRVWNPPGNATQLPVYAIFKPFGFTSHYRYTDAIADGNTWLLPPNADVRWWVSMEGRTVRFEIASSSGHTQCVYLVPGSSNVTNGKCP